VNDSIEDKLRRALRPVDAPPGFTEKLMAALPPRPVHAVAPAPVRRPPPRQRWWVPAAAAASLVAAVLAGQHMAQLRAEREGAAARQQLMQALRVTSEKLDLAYQAVNSAPEGAEENRS